MNKGLKVIAGLGVVGGLIAIICILIGMGLSLYGLYLAFSASFILGVAALILEPSPLVFGLVMFIWEKNLPEAIMNYLNS